MLTTFAALMAAGGLAMASMAGYVAWRRDSRMGWSLALLLVSVAWWGLAYAVELSADDLTDKARWGAIKYVGITTLAPTWLIFVLQYTGHGDRVTRRLLLLLGVAPVITLSLLAHPSTRELVRSYPVTDDALPIVVSGPAFWAVMVYNNLLLVVATVMFVASMVRLARTYRRMALVLIASSLLPWAANVLHNLQVGAFARLDLTPFAFIVTGGLLVWGLFHERLIDLTPLARGAVLDSMQDAVLVLAPFGRIVDVNPAAVALVSVGRVGLLGRRLEDVFPEAAQLDAGSTELTLRAPDSKTRRTFDVSRQVLADRGGRLAGELVVLREVTQRVRDQERLQQVLAEKSRIAASLQASLVPTALPLIEGNELASQYEPAGDGSEIGGDFLDVFGLGDDTWAWVIGDVSGKGAEAAAASAATRYALRALGSAQRSPAETLREVNAKLLPQTDSERHCTLVYGHLKPSQNGTRVTLSLAGHHPPLVLRHTGIVEEVGCIGTALALFDDPQLSDTTAELTTGELLCAFTDGLVEARRGGEMFGTDRVAQVLQQHGHLPIDQIATMLTAAVRDFHGQQLPDDLAVLILRNTGASVSMASDGVNGLTTGSTVVRP